MKINLNKKGRFCVKTKYCCAHNLQQPGLYFTVRDTLSFLVKDNGSF